jgi:uncharacterized protein (TIGR04255 family)
LSSAEPDPYPRRHYASPPVVEAIVRVRLARPIPWSLTTAGLLYSRLRAAYPREPQTQNLMQAELSEVAQNQANLQVRSGPQKVVFGTDDGSRLLVVGAQDVSAHGLPPYEGWESLEQRLFDGLDQLGDVIPERAFTGLGVRYINRVTIPRTEFRFDEYLTIGFTGPPGFPPNVSGFFDRVESVYPDERTRIAFTWATTESEPESSAFILDFDLNWSCDEGETVTVGQAREELSNLKQKETAAFESLLQDSLRELFDEDR